MSRTAAEKLVAIERELRYRQRVYPRWIEEERISGDFATEQIAIFAEIADDYQQLAERERLI